MRHEEWADRLHRAWGDEIRRRRENAGYTQRDLARVLGLRQGTISRIERGDQVPADGVKRDIAGVFGARIGDIFSWPSDVPAFPTEYADWAAE